MFITRISILTKSHLIFLLLLLSSIAPVFASDEGNTDELFFLKQQLTAWQRSHAEQVTPYEGSSFNKELNAAKLAVTKAQLGFEAALNRVSETQEQVAALETTILELKQLQAAKLQNGDKLKKRLSKNLQALSQLEADLIQQQKILQVREAILAEGRSWQQALTQSWQDYESHQLLQGWQLEIDRLMAERQTWQERLQTWRAEKGHETDAVTVDILEAEETIHLVEQQIHVLELQHEFYSVRQNFENRQHNLQLLSDTTAALKMLTANQGKTAESVQQRINLLQRYNALLPESKQSKATAQLVNQLILAFEKILLNLDGLAQEMKIFETEMTVGQNSLTYRQSLPSSLAQWQTLGQSILHLPAFTRQLLIQQGSQMLQALSEVSVLMGTVLLLSQSAWFYLCYALWRVLQRALKRSDEKNNVSFSARALRFFAESLGRNILSTLILSAVGILIIFHVIMAHSLLILIWLGVVWFIFKFMVTVARMILVENTEHVEGRDVKLFYLIRAAFFLGGLMTAAVIIFHQLTLPIDVAGFIDRFYMLILLFISYPLLRYSDIIFEVFSPSSAEKTYLQRTARLLVFLFPLTIFSNAAIGLLGYVNLAWQIGWIEGQLSLLFCAWLISRGLLSDFFDFLSEFCIRRLANGWLWAQALLKPLQEIALITLTVLALLTAISFIAAVFDVPMLENLYNTLLHPLFGIGESQITLMNIISTFIALSVVYWSAKWSREFSYRWFYNKVRDSGVRNSLAVFTQYAVVVIGFFLLLHILGIDLTTITVVAAALSIGIAFGVRDIVNNILSGILLLIERPVRRGDWIAVGEDEGEVTHIGLRAITLRTGNNTEVIVPNTHTMIKPFTNWTKQDSIIRGSFTLRLDFHDNPNWVRQVILESITAPEVLAEPAPSVLLKEVADDALILEIRYYLDLRRSRNRAKIRSDVISAAWYALQEKGIQLALPQRRLWLNKED